MSWSPPEEPDPNAIKMSARDDFINADYEVALKKHQWYFEHAITFQPSQYGVRRSFALADWHELGKSYSPAMEALVQARDDSIKKVRLNIQLRESFFDVCAINRKLDAHLSTCDTFKLIVSHFPEHACSVYESAQKALLDQKEYDLCCAYVEPDQQLQELLRVYTQISETIGKKNPERLPFLRQQSSNDGATIVALLVTCERAQEASMVASKLNDAIQCDYTRQVVNAALLGAFPD